MTRQLNVVVSSTLVDDTAPLDVMKKRFYTPTKEEQRGWYLNRLKKAILERYEKVYMASPGPSQYKKYHILTAREAKTRTFKLSSNIREIAQKRQYSKCGICFKKLEGKVVIDHIYPLTMIDKRSINADKNVQLVHNKCNAKKGVNHPIDFMRRKGFLL